MLSKEEAVAAAKRFLDDIPTYLREPITIVMQPELGVEYPHHWSIVYTSQEYLDTGDRTKGPFSGVVVVPKDGSDPEFPPTAIPTDKYIEQLEAKLSKPPEE